MTAPRILVRAPDHLGDSVLALSAIRALAQLGPTTVVGPRWARELYAHLGVAVIGTRDRIDADLAVLFKPAFRAAWATRHVPRRVGLSWDGRWWLLTTAVVPTGRHRLDDFAALAAAAGADPSARAPPEFAGQPHEVPPDAVLLLPGTASPETVRWRAFRKLADALGDRAIFAAGPGEGGMLERIAGPHRRLPALSLPALAGVAARVRAVVGNDSGLTHLAAAARRAAGTDPSRVHVVYASTDPARTGPPGTTAWHGVRPPCWPCYRKRCPFGAPCRTASVQPLVDALG